ncbi:MAG: hypothetical protein ABMB14_34430 [Myxococcota bacterium]
MAFTVTFPTAGPPTPVQTLTEWLTERGEAFVPEGEDTLALRGLPMRLVTSPHNQSIQAQLEVVPNLPLIRLVDTLFEIARRAGADVNLAGHGPVTRPELWLRLADEQDRLRIAQSLRRAREHGNADEVHKRLWAMVASFRPGHDDRWDATAERVVELCEVGEALTVDQAAWLGAVDPKPGDPVAVPVTGYLHCLVWRWLSEAYPGLSDAP